VSTIPRQTGEVYPAGDVIRAAGHRYIAERGWAVFPERTGPDGVRRSLPMCPACRATPHRPDACPHTTCHGLYAGTRDPDAWDRTCDAFPDADVLAVRTGRASGIFVVDFDVKHGGPEAHDAWEEVTGLPWSFPNTLRQRTRSGGFHLVYALPNGTDVRSRNAVTRRGVDVKAEGGLVIVPPSPGYEWLNDLAPRPPSPEVTEWARTAPVFRSGTRRRLGVVTAQRVGSRVGTDAGTRLVRLVTDVVPVGSRDEFVNNVAFLLRKAGLAWDDAREVMREQHALLEHPEGDEFRWEWCEYKLRKVWRDVKPDPVAAAGRSWYDRARGFGAGRPAGSSSDTSANIYRRNGRRAFTGDQP